MHNVFYMAAASHQDKLEGPAATIFGAFIFFFFIASIIQTISYWFVFIKAGRKGWESLVPLYETWVRFQIAGKPGWWLFPAIVPVVGLVLSMIAMIEIAKRFGKSWPFGVMMTLFPYVGYPILAFGDAKYSEHS